MRMVDVKYDEYAVIHTIKTKGGVITVVNKLYGKVIIIAVPHTSLWMCSAAQCTHADSSPVVQQAVAWTSALTCWRSSGSSPWRLESCLKTSLSFPEMVLFTSFIRFYVKIKGWCYAPITIIFSFYPLQRSAQLPSFWLLMRQWCCLKTWMLVASSLHQGLCHKLNKWIQKDFCLFPLLFQMPLDVK